MAFSRLFPELEHLDSESERRAVYNKAFGCLRRRQRFWALWLLVQIGVAAIAALLAIRSRRILPVTAPLAGALIGVIMAVTFAWLLQAAFRRPLQRLMRLELVERGISLCVECGYDLRGQTTPRCPGMRRAVRRREDINNNLQESCWRFAFRSLLFILAILDDHSWVAAPSASALRPTLVAPVVFFPAFW